MGLIDSVIPQKELDLDYNSAKIIASPYDYKLTKRIITRITADIGSKFNIFVKTNNTENLLAEKLDLATDILYMKLNPNIYLSSLPKVNETPSTLYEIELKLGMCGNLIEYNNLNIDEYTLVNDLSFLTGNCSSVSIKQLKTKSYLKALEVLQIKSVNKSSLIPNLMYLVTEYKDRCLDDIENIKFAEEKIAKKEAPIFASIRSCDDEEDIVPEALLEANAFLLPRIVTNPYGTDVDMLNTIDDSFYRLGLAYSIIYGAELLYNFDSIKDDTLRNAIEELFSVNYAEDTFCSKYLYQIDAFGHIDINPKIKACFSSDNELRFNSIRTLLDSLLTTPDMCKDIKANWAEFTLPTFFMRMVCSMHSYAYQVGRIKHATLLYKTAKDAGVIDKNEFNEEVSSGDEIFGVGASTGMSDEGEDNELIHLDTFSDKDEGSMSIEKSIEKEKSVMNKTKETPPTLNAADMLKKDLHDSPYDYDITFVKNDIANKEAYNLIASNIKMITHELSRQIKEIKTYNTGGKQNGLLVGKLDKKNLWKYKTDPHIFYNNNYKLKEMDLAFGCILDESGSMYGEKIKNGRIVMIMLHEVLNSLGINHSIIGHTSHDMYQTKIYKYFQFKEEGHYSLNKPYGLVKADNRSGNCDSGALFYMQSVMKQVRNKDKIVIIFSDGQPTECTDLDLINQVNNMEKNGIHVIGVGINFDSIKEYYPDNANGKNLKEMVDIVVSILKRYVLEKKE